ncbi:MAG TPA: DUF4097 family beta strand repeat-containing protein [Vicinamibacterales bacterium]
MKTTVLTGSLLAAAALGSACVVSVDSQGQIVREEKRYSVTGTPELRLTTFDGAIEIQAWDKPDVAIDIEKRGPTKEAVDALEIKSAQTGNKIELEVKRPREERFSGFGFHQSASARLIVSVPRDVNVIARSGDGSIRVEGVNGRLELRTGDGGIRASDVSGELILDTGDGSITVEGARGRLALETGDGGVNVSGRLTSVKLHTGDGAIVYRADPGTEMSDNWEITTGDGGVTLYLPPGFAADLDAHTGDGSIRNELDVASTSESNNHDENRRTLRGRLGSGGRQIRVRTGDGTIRLRPS